jgi:hypothetical protein
MRHWPARKRFGGPAGPHRNRSAAGLVRLAQLFGRRDDLPAAGEVGSWQQVEDVVELRARVLDDVRGRLRHFLQVMGRNARREADRDPERAVQQSERQARREQHRLLELAVVVLDEIDGAFADLGEHQLRIARKLRLGVAIGGCRIAVARAEIALAVDQRVAHRERLREVHQRLVRRAVAVRVILAEHLADVTARTW